MIFQRPVRAGFRKRWATFNVFPLNSRVVAEAEQLLDKYGGVFGLRTLDALHLGAFQLAAESDWHFVAADRNLCRVVTELGFNILNPAQN